MAKLWLVACGLRLGYLRRPQVTCCLRLDAINNKPLDQVWAFIRCDQFTYRKFLRHFYSTATHLLDPRSSSHQSVLKMTTVIGPGLKGVALCWVSTTTPLTRKDLRISIPQFLILYKHLTIFCQEDNIG